MPYDERLAARIRSLLAARGDVEEKRMFGGLAFMVGGHMAIGVVKDDLLVRVGADAFSGLVREPHARPMDFTGQPSKGALFVAAAGLESGAVLQAWVSRGVAYAQSTPDRARRPGRARRAR